MHRSLIVALTLVLSVSAFAQELPFEGSRMDRGERIRGCATHQPTDFEAQAIEEATAEFAALQSRSGSRFETEAVATVKVYVHVITNTSGTGNITDAVIANQLRVLNDSFSGVTGGFNTKFRFTLAGTDRTANNSYFGAGYGTTAERNMKNALRK
ncbi:MAG TPA: hypothetical protein VGQ76_15630, partial [Thermoanaerobaculia bacterium]|nr:hypothetical protein [Thermoanaerobaculia bacterium]